MPTDITVPALGESVVEATIARWLKKEGETVASGEAVVELETDKVDLEVPADKGGILVKINRQEGDDVQIGDVLGVIDETDAPNATAPATTTSSKKTAPAASASPPDTPSTTKSAEQVTPDDERDDNRDEIEATPVAKRFAADQAVDLGAVSGSGMGGRVTKSDVESYIQGQESPAQSSQVDVASAPEAPRSQPIPIEAEGDPRGEERIRMSRRRRTIAQRLVMAQQTAAMLTTFNEIDMSAVMNMRKRRQEQFVAANGIKLGFTSFFVKATIGALKAFPMLNAEIQETDIVLKHYYDIGIAVGAKEGLVVPVLRDAGQMSFAEIEQATKAFVQKSQSGTLSIGDLLGGTFTITNGGVFGSMLSTPILNPPQVGILGLHKIEDRPVVVKNEAGEKEIAIRPMMYVALSYDHRIVDGREAVQFLVKIKELIEDPEELLLAG